MSPAFPKPFDGYRNSYALHLIHISIAGDISVQSMREAMGRVVDPVIMCSGNSI